MIDPTQRRNNPRNTFHCFARFRHFDASLDSSERLCVTRDFSHDGLYFVVMDDSIRQKMQLLLRFPYLSDSEAVERECVVEVVRTQNLFPGRCGVGARLILHRNPVLVESRLTLPTASHVNVASRYLIDQFA